MTRDEKIAAVVVTAALTVFVLVAGPSLGWPAWVWLPVAALPPGAAWWLVRAVSTKRAQDRIRAEIAEAAAPRPAPPAPEQPRQEALTEVSLRSAAADYRFLLSATVHWVPNPSNPGRAHGNLGALARDAIVSRAVAVLANEQPDEHSALGERLNGLLGVALAVPSAQIDAWASDVSVALPEPDRKRLHRLAEVRKEEEVWERERDHERNVREYLRDDVLRDPASAVVWWLARQYDDGESGLHATVDSIPQLRRLTAAAHDTEIPSGNDSARAEPAHPWSVTVSSAWQHVLAASGDDGPRSPFMLDGASDPRQPVEHLLAFTEAAVHGVEDGECALFVERMARVLDAHEQHEAAARLRQRFTSTREAHDFP